MISTMVRSEDTIREPRSFYGDSDEDNAAEMSESNAPSLDSNSDEPTDHEDDTTALNASPSDDGSSSKYRVPQSLPPEEVIELARRSVDNGIQETKRSMAGNEAVSDVVKPKLTIDLGHSNIGRVPEAVVDIIKDEVERYVRCLSEVPVPGTLA